MITFQYELWSGCVDEMRPLWPEHWAELARDKESIVLDCDEEKYQKAEALGSLHIVTVRSDGKLVGYYYGMLMDHLHYKSSGLMCFSDVYFLKPEFRKGNTGIRFIAAFMRSLKARGVVKLYISTKTHQNNGRVFEAMGMTHTDDIYTILL